MHARFVVINVCTNEYGTFVWASFQVSASTKRGLEALSSLVKHENQASIAHVHPQTMLRSVKKQPPESVYRKQAFGGAWFSWALA